MAKRSEDVDVTQETENKKKVISVLDLVEFTSHMSLSPTPKKNILNSIWVFSKITKFCAMNTSLLKLGENMVEVPIPLSFFREDGLVLLSFGPADNPEIIKSLDFLCKLGILKFDFSVDRKSVEIALRKVDAKKWLDPRFVSVNRSKDNLDCGELGEGPTRVSKRISSVADYTKDNFYLKVLEAYPSRKMPLNKKRGFALVNVLLSQGEKEDSILSAVKEYARLSEENKTDPSYIMDITTFFGRDARYLNYAKSSPEKNSETENLSTEEKAGIEKFMAMMGRR